MAALLAATRALRRPPRARPGAKCHTKCHSANKDNPELFPSCVFACRECVLLSCVLLAKYTKSPSCTPNRPPGNRCTQKRLPKWLSEVKRRRVTSPRDGYTRISRSRRPSFAIGPHAAEEEAESAISESARSGIAQPENRTCCGGRLGRARRPRSSIIAALGRRQTGSRSARDAWRHRGGHRAAGSDSRAVDQLRALGRQEGERGDPRGRRRRPGPSGQHPRRAPM